MVQAGTGAIYRITTTGDTEATAKTGNQIIEFGTGADTPDAKSFIETVNIRWIEDTSVHPNPNKALNNIQDGLLNTREVTIRGWFEDPDNATGPARISTWMKDAKTNTSLPNGRFGLRVDDFSTILDQTPSATTGYILFDAELDIPPDHPFECNFTLHFYMTGTHP